MSASVSASEVVSDSPSCLSTELVADVLSLVVLPAVDKVQPKPGSFLTVPLTLPDPSGVMQTS